MNSKVSFKIATFGLAAMACTSSALASYTPIVDVISLPNSAFSNYALIVGGTNSLHLTSDSPINGNIAIGGAPGTTYATLQGGNDHVNSFGTYAGNVDFSGSSSTSGGLTVAGAINQNVVNAQNAVADAQSLLSLYSALTSLPTVAAGTLNVTTNGGNHGSNEHVYAFTGSQLTALTINAAASEYVIININQNSNSNFAFAGGVTLNGGIDKSHVLFLVDTTGNFQITGSGHGSIINGIILDNAGNTNLDNFTLNGQLFCNSSAGSNCSVVSNAVINQAKDIGGAATPEPASLSMALGGGLLIALGALRNRFKRD